MHVIALYILLGLLTLGFMALLFRTIDLVGPIVRVVAKWLFARWGEFAVVCILAIGAWEVAKDTILLPAQLIWVLITGDVP